MSGDAERRPTRRRTKAESRASTRLAILDAAVDLLIDEGYAHLTTRRVSERAGVAQSTQMFHFPTRESFLLEALGRVAQRMTEEALDGIAFDAMRDPERREALLDQAWAAFSSPVARAATELWVASYNEPELAAAMRQLEGDVASLVSGAASSTLPELAEDPRFGAMLDAAIALMRGLALSLPVAGAEATEARWRAIKPLLLEGAATLLDARAPR